MNQPPNLPECRPEVPDHADFVPRFTREGRRIRRATLVGQYTEPTQCSHPVTARVWPNRTGYIATCHDCGASELRTGRWELAR